MKRAWLVLTVLLALDGLAWAAGARKPLPPLRDRLTKRVDCELNAEPFLAAFAALQAQCNFNAVIDPNLRKKNPKLTIKLTGVECSNVLMTLCRDMGTMCSQLNGVVSIGYPEFIGRVRRINAPRTADNALYLGLIRRVSVDLIDTPLPDAAAFLQKHLKINIIVLPSGNEKDELITLKLTNVKARVVLKYTALIAKRTAYVQEGIVIFSAPPKPKQEPAPKPEPEPDPKPKPKPKPEPEPEPEPEMMPDDF